VPVIVPRTACTSRATGFTATNARSQPGIVRGSTKMCEANVSGIRMSQLSVITVDGLLTTSASTVKVQPRGERGAYARLEARARLVAEAHERGSCRCSLPGSSLGRACPVRAKNTSSRLG
jgi:hypothetical protein